MPNARPVPAEVPPGLPENPEWPKLVVRVPPDWKRWLEQAAEARALPVAALVRQCIRALMIERHNGGG
jgi:hypothetical protein